MKIFLILCVIVATSTAYQLSDIVSAKIESCRGCSLNRLPQVKSFVMEDAPFYERLEVKFISGAAPELVLLGEGDRELERIPLSNLSREGCNQLMQDKGFDKKTEKSDL